MDNLLKQVAVEIKLGQSVVHKKKRLHDATFQGWSKSNKRIGVKHNRYAPWGVSMVVDWFKPESIEVIN